ncbi:ABC-2 type transport system ATP-binding protein [Amycolatopsis arida]|uniref:ABC-2 type transport system ATP-binding protein n=1 Tax=Amycolatopsis arida TaxID=587909 RepID=A0A1I5SS73_9PSEU|nr:ATP-binding cassette domain-containing protein [Amycolatopsis arida]TDX96368.1 ABC-2 type transport system ATP-binding protein [Amycolatopsis arida]SFP73652.1 ABC-2 type transport system ATP-binding protein [Amycolatopsis arida]
MDTAIDVRGLRKSFGAVSVLEGVDLRVEPGRMLALLGPNGAGKTTTVRILGTLLRPDGGTATVAGYDVVRRARQVRRVIGLTGQQAAVDGLLTGRENLVLMGRLFRLAPAAARRRAGELLERFDLADAADRQVRTYSGGMRRRLDLAISLITAPAVLFLDEPTTGLDPRSRLAVWDTVRELMGTGVTILLTTQYLEEADQLADRVAVIDHGRVVAEGTADELKRRVGAERLELVFPAPPAFGIALRLLAAEQPRGDEPTLGLSLPVTGARDVRRILDRLAEAGAEPDRLAVSTPTLDDVFLTLTGHPAPAETSGGTR